jgi:hypothetical protein
MTDGQQCRLITDQHRHGPVVKTDGWARDCYCYRRPFCLLRAAPGVYIDPPGQDETDVQEGVHLGLSNVSE